MPFTNHFRAKNWRIYLAGAPAMVEAASLACTHSLVAGYLSILYAMAFYPRRGLKAVYLALLHLKQCL